MFKNLLFLTSLLVCISCATTSVPSGKGSSLTATEFDSELVTEIDFLQADVSKRSDEYSGYVGGKKNEVSAEEIKGELITSIDSVFNVENIDLTLPTESIYRKEKATELVDEIEKLNEYYFAEKTTSVIRVDRHPSFDFSDSDINLNNDYGMYLYLLTNFNFSYSANEVANISVNYTTELYAYLFDLKSNKTVWVYNFTSPVSVEYLNLDHISMSFLMSIKYGKDFLPRTFSIKPIDDKVLVYLFDGNVLFADIKNVDGFIIEVENIDGLRKLHMNEISKIEIAQSKEKIFPFEL